MIQSHSCYRYTTRQDWSAGRRYEDITGGGRATPFGRRRVWFEDKWLQSPAYAREALRAGNRINGPALVEEHASTTLVQPGDRLEVDGYGNLDIEVGAR